MTDVTTSLGFPRKGLDLVATESAPITAVAIHSLNR
jgi:hypothetical protein